MFSKSLMGPTYLLKGTLERESRINGLETICSNITLHQFALDSFHSHSKEFRSLIYYLNLRDFIMKSVAFLIAGSGA